MRAPAIPPVEVEVAGAVDGDAATTGDVEIDAMGGGGAIEGEPVAKGAGGDPALAVCQGSYQPARQPSRVQNGQWLRPSKTWKPSEQSSPRTKASCKRRRMRRSKRDGRRWRLKCPNS